MKQRLTLVFTLLLVLFLTSPVSAQTSTSSPTVTTSPTSTISPRATTETSTTTTSTLTDSSNPFNFTTRSIVLTRLRRFFTRNQVKRAELTLAISNALLQQAQAQIALGNTTRAESLLDAHTREMTFLQTTVETIAQNTTESTILSFLDQVLEDKTEQIAQLELINPLAAAELSNKIISVRAKALKEIVKLLVHPNLTDAEREKKLSQIIEKYTRKETKIDAKITKKLAFIDDLDDETEEEDDVLKVDLEEQEDDAVDDAAKLEKNELDDVIDQLEDEEEHIERSLIVLEKLLATVPAEAKNGIETAINAIMQREVPEFEKNPQIISAFANNLTTETKSQELAQKILERLKKLSEKSNEATKKEIEKNLEAAKKRTEQLKEEEKKKLEDRDNDNDSSASPKPTSEATASTESSSIEIKVENGQLDKSTFEVKKGSRLTVRVKNSDDNAIKLTLSNGTSVTIAANQETNLASFTISAPLTFSITLGSETLTGTINTK